MKHFRAAIRFVSFVAMTLGLYALWWIGSIFFPNRIYWRQTCFRLWSRAFVKISGMRIEVVGEPPRPPFFLVSNHLSYTDIPAFRAVTEAVFVAKGEIEGWFMAGRIVGDMGTVFINRQNRRDIPRAGAKIIERIEQGEGVIVFPEGTSTRGEEVLPFNSSFLEFAAKSDLPVSYASISYQTPGDPLKAGEVVCWWEDISFLAHIWRLFQLKEFTAVITFGEEPISRQNRKELAHELRERVSEKFVPVV